MDRIINVDYYFGALRQTGIPGFPTRRDPVTCIATASREDILVSIEQLSLDAFAPCEGTIFQLHHEGSAPLELKLLHATAIPVMGNRSSLCRAEPFELAFRSEGAVYARQGCYRITHAQLGELELFLVPVGRENDGTCYQVIFN